jgi:hypothetical protein
MTLITSIKKELTKEQKRDFFDNHLAHRLTLLRCLRNRSLQTSIWKGKGDIYRCVKDSNLIAVRLFMDFLGLKGIYNGNNYELIQNPNPDRFKDDVKLDRFRGELLKPSDVSQHFHKLLAGIYARADKELAHLTLIFNEEFNQEEKLIEAATVIEQLLKEFLYDPLKEQLPPIST